MLDSMVYRQDSAKQRQPVFKFTHRSKIGIFATQGRIVASIHVKFGGAEGTWVRLVMQNFMPIGARLWEHSPQNGKNFHFLVQSRPIVANPLTDFYNCWGIFTINYPALVFAHLTWFASQVTELLLKNHASVIYPNLFMHPVGKTMRWIEKWLVHF